MNSFLSIKNGETTKVFEKNVGAALRGAEQNIFFNKECLMAELTDEKNQEVQNEIEFSKTKGFSYINYCTIKTAVTFNENDVSLNKSTKWFYVFGGKPNPTTIDYNSIENVEVKTHFSIGDLIFALFFFVMWPVTGEIWLAAFTLVFLFCSYGKNIIITRKDSVKTIIMSEGLGQGDELALFCKKMSEKGIPIVEKKK
jgi:hypothetical protein